MSVAAVQNKGASGSRDQLLWSAVFLLALILFLFLSAVFKSVVVDDTYITFRYAYNIAHGLGIRWNPGERPVEGCTEFLWMLASAAALRLGYNPLAAAQILSFLFSLATVLLPLTPINQVSSSWRSRFLAASLLAIAPVAAFYGVSGMGHPLFTFLFTAAALTLHRAMQSGARPFFVAAGLLFGLATLARPEGFEFCLVSGIILVAWSVLKRGHRAEVLSFAAAYLCFYLPYTSWRLKYYGFFFPNTYYAKHTGGFLMNLPSGLFYLAQELDIYAGAAVVCCLIGLLMRRNDKTALNYVKAEAPGIALLLLVLSILAYTTLLGGDDVSPFPSVRLLTPALPILYILTAECIESLFPGRHSWHALAALSAMGVFFLSQTYDAFGLVKASHSSMVGTDSPVSVLRTAFRRPPAEHYHVSPLVQWMNATLPDGCLVAIPWAGRAGYRNKCTLIDEDGLNDLHIAHLPKRQRGADVKGDADYVLGRHPDLIFVNVNPAYARGMSFTAAGGWKLTDKELADKCLRSADYKLLEVPVPDAGLVFQRVR